MFPPGTGSLFMALRRPLRCLPRLLTRFVPLLVLLSTARAATADSQQTGSTASADDVLARQPSAPVVVYLVRHAEKDDDGTDDPPLTLAGRIRAQDLRHLLADSDVTRIHTTDLRRTRGTARPIAVELGLEPSLYDPTDLEGFAAQLLAMPARHLVVGHSNTTPVLVEALGGGPQEAISEMEYDLVFLVVIPPGQPAVTTVLRYGEPFVPGSDFGLRSGAMGWSRPGSG